MIITIGENQLINLVATQLRNIFLCDSQELNLLNNSVPQVIPLIKRCFSENTNKYYRDAGGNAIFNPYHSGQYSIFLYFLSRFIWKEYGKSSLPDKVYYLNKMLNSCDLYYEVELPNIFFLEHPVGSVMGRAKFSNYFVFQQNCTVGGNKSDYPILGEYVWLFANAMVIGASKIGNNVFISAGSCIKDANIPDNTIVFGQSPNLILKHKPSHYFYSRSPFLIHRKYAEKDAASGM